MTVECKLTCFRSSGVISWKVTLLAIEQAWIFLDDALGSSDLSKICGLAASLFFAAFILRLAAFSLVLRLFLRLPDPEFMMVNFKL